MILARLVTLHLVIYTDTRSTSYDLSFILHVEFYCHARALKLKGPSIIFKWCHGGGGFGSAWPTMLKDAWKSMTGGGGGGILAWHNLWTTTQQLPPTFVKLFGMTRLPLLLAFFNFYDQQPEWGDTGRGQGVEAPPRDHHGVRTLSLSQTLCPGRSLDMVRHKNQVSVTVFRPTFGECSFIISWH